MKSKIWGTLSLGLMLAACSDESCRDGQVVATQPESQFNQPGSIADFQATSGDRLYFAFDNSSVKEDQKCKAAAMTQWLNKYPNVNVRVGGYCDERGTSAYNLALGQQRANATVKALKASGLSACRIKETCSQGKEHPLVAGSNEDAWKENRVGLVVLDNQGCPIVETPANAEASSNPLDTMPSDVPMPEDIPAM